MAADPIAVESSEQGASTRQRRLPSDLSKMLNRLNVLERTARNNSGGIGSGGLVIYDGGTLTWYDRNTEPYSACPDLASPIEESPNSHLAFQISTQYATSSDPFSDSKFEYFFPYEGFCKAVVTIGVISDPDGSGEGHGLQVLNHGDGTLALSASDDGIKLKRRNKTNLANSDIIKSVSGLDDHFNLFTDDSIELSRYFGVRVSTAHEDAHVVGGLLTTASGAPTYECRTRVQLNHDVAKVHLKDDQTGANAPLECGTITSPSSETIKKVHGDFTADALAEVVATKIKSFSYLIGPSRLEIDDAIRQGKKVPEPAPEDVVRIGPIAETVPEQMFVAPTRDDEVASVDMFAAQWTLWRAVQQQQDLIVGMQKQIDGLTKQVDALTKKIKLP